LIDSTSEIGILAPNIVRESGLPRGWRRRGGFASLEGVDDVDLLARAFRLEAGSMAAAPLHYLGMTGKDPLGYCLFAYPVYLHARREQLILMTGPEFEPSSSEVDDLAESIRAHFPEWRIEVTIDTMWFVIIDEDPHLETTPLQHVLGENINDHLPRGGDAMRWHGILNELQMLLFDSPVNTSREAAGRPPINSLWFWGGGRLPSITDSPWRRVVTNNAVARGLGRAAQIDTHWQEQPPAHGTPGGAITDPGTLWVVGPPDDADPSAPFLSPEQWRALRHALRQGDIERLSLIEPGYGELVIDKRAAASWWPW